MNSNFGEELSLEEILTDEEKAHDKFVSSAPGANFGPELTLDEVIDLLQNSALPPRAMFWEDNRRIVQEAVNKHDTTIEIGDFTFKIEYFARITAVRRFDFSTPMSYIQFYPNGKGQSSDDPQSRSSDSSTTGSPSDSDV